MRQLALPKVDEAGLLLAAFSSRILRQLVDDLAEVRQTLVDLAELFQALPFRIRVVDFLTPSQVHDVEARCPDDLLSILVHRRSFDESREHSVGSRTH